MSVKKIKENNHLSLLYCIKRAYRTKKAVFISLLALNLFVLTTLIIFPFYCNYMWYGEGSDIITCSMIKLLKIYCPSCGGTRALYYLLRFDFIRAFIYSPILVYIAVIFAYSDIRAVVSLLKDEKRLLYLNVPMAWCAVGITLGVWIIRNVLLVFFGIDFLGDLGGFWQAFHALN